jgi:hypothetical protein
LYVSMNVSLGSRSVKITPFSSYRRKIRELSLLSFCLKTKDGWT